MMLRHFTTSPLLSLVSFTLLFRRILDEPNVDKHYRIYTKSNIFHNYVWRWEEAQEYLLYMGWVMVSN